MRLIYELVTKHFGPVATMLGAGLIIIFALLELRRRRWPASSAMVPAALQSDHLPQIFHDRETLRRAVEMEIEQYLDEARPGAVFHETLHKALSAEKSIAETLSAFKN